MAFRFLPPEWLAETTSTNDVLKNRLAAGPVPVGTVIAARRQTRGRGRMGNDWLSADEGDLTFSFYWEGAVPASRAGSLPMAVALAVREFLALYGVASLCKWPNDVMTSRGKIAGILAEGAARPAGGFGLVVGVGVNVRSVAGRDELFGRRTAAISEFARPGRAVGAAVAALPDASALLGEALPCLAEWLSRWEDGGFGGIAAELESCLWGRGQTVTARVSGEERVSGKVAGLGPDGELCLTLADGGKRLVASLAALEGWDGPAGQSSTGRILVDACSGLCNNHR